ncbi:MAG TPA: hypothetical protein VMH91_00255 [Candidatus Paceibacterota bacterium]|nr:hypothetical protein [Candidatus Paceibacterota bacterium]
MQDQWRRGFIRSAIASAIVAVPIALFVLPFSYDSPTNHTPPMIEFFKITAFFWSLVFIPALFFFAPFTTKVRVLVLLGVAIVMLLVMGSSVFLLNV